MRYSLRTLLIVMLLGGPLCAWGWREWQTWTLRQDSARAGARPFVIVPGSPASMAQFLRVVKIPAGDTGIPWVAKDCFVIGAPASNYKHIFSQADVRGIPDKPEFANGTQFEFWCGGNKDDKVVVIVDGNPPIVVYARFEFFEQGRWQTNPFD